MSVRLASRLWAFFFGLAALVGFAIQAPAQTPPPAFRTFPSPAPIARAFDAEFSIYVPSGTTGFRQRPPEMIATGSTIDIAFDRDYCISVACPGHPIYKTFRIRMPALAEGSYTIRFKDDDEIVASFPLTVGGEPAPLPVDFHVSPTEGMWWSNEAPGTGVAFNVDKVGRWFAAIYLYETDGSPTFLTMQGEAIEYSRDVLEPYARVRSRLILSHGGQCLACPWRPATAAYTDEEAEIVFYSRNRAELRVGDWKLRLAPLPETPLEQSWAHEYYSLESDYYLVTVRSSARNTIIVARLEKPISTEPPTSRPWTDYFLECVDCHVATGQGNSSIEQAQALQHYLREFALRCELNTRQSCHAVSLWNEPFGFLLQRELIDEGGQQIVLLDYGDGPRGDTKITIEALPADWWPILP